MHNFVKLFSKPFNKYVETFTDGVDTDMKSSFDIRDALKEFCVMLSISYNLPLKEYHIGGYRCMIVVRFILNFLINV